MEFIFNREISPEEIKSIRKSLKLKQKDLANFLNVYEKTIANWESGKNPVKSSAVPLLRLLKYNPSLIEKYKKNENKSTLRVYYMFKNDICSIIDVDYPKNCIYVKDYIDNPFYKAFGNNINPTIEDFEYLLESRCVPKERGDIKDYLQSMGLPFYDPMLIIEKTEGRTTEDDFWLKIERANG